MNRIGNGLRVLVVDSNQDSQEIITCFLESLNYQVFSVYSAIAALSAVKLFKPDIVLSELLLPQRDGYWLMRGTKRSGLSNSSDCRHCSRNEPGARARLCSRL